RPRATHPPYGLAPAGGLRVGPARRHCTERRRDRRRDRSCARRARRRRVGSLRRCPPARRRRAPRRRLSRRRDLGGPGRALRRTAADRGSDARRALSHGCLCPELARSAAGSRGARAAHAVAVSRVAAAAMLCVMLAACASGPDEDAIVPTQHRTLVVNESPTPICVALAITAAEQVAG